MQRGEQSHGVELRARIHRSCRREHVPLHATGKRFHRGVDIGGNIRDVVDDRIEPPISERGHEPGVIGAIAPPPPPPPRARGPPPGPPPPPPARRADSTRDLPPPSTTPNRSKRAGTGPAPTPSGSPRCKGSRGGPGGRARTRGG